MVERASSFVTVSQHFLHAACLFPTPPSLLPATLPLSPQHPTVAIQTITVPPEQLRKHGEANGCGVAALPPGALHLPPGASYEAAVQLVVEAVERSFYEQLLAAAGSAAGSAAAKA